MPHSYALSTISEVFKSRNVLELSHEGLPFLSFFENSVLKTFLEKLKYLKEGNK